MIEEREQRLEHQRAEELYLRNWVEKLTLEIARLHSMQFGRASEKLGEGIEQLELIAEDLPRETVNHEPATSCPYCGGTMKRIGEDVAEMLECVPACFKVIRHGAKWVTPTPALTFAKERDGSRVIAGRGGRDPDGT